MNCLLSKPAGHPRRYRSGLLTAVCLLVLGLSPARACDCLPQTMQHNYRRADIVLRIHIASIQDTVHYDLYSKPIRPPFAAGTQVVVRVRHVYKGAVQGKNLIIKGMGGMCDYHFLRGGDYVVFLYKQAADPPGQYVTSTCQHHFNLRDTAARREFARARQAEK